MIVMFPKKGRSWVQLFLMLVVVGCGLEPAYERTNPDDPKSDLDGDSILAGVDNCPNDANADQADTDGDGVGDLCDNCPNDANADQADMDGDGIGAVCDPDTFDMVSVPAGPFWRGSCNESSTPSCGPGEEGYTKPIDLDETPLREITLDAFWIDRTEVTVGAYRACVNAGVCAEPAHGQYCNWGVPGREDHPINCVSWKDAVDFCAWEGKELPTEAEWEKAARGTDGRKYPWGNEEPHCDRGNFDDCVGSTTAVGSYPAGASPYGALDMAGNVEEWVADWYSSSYYASSPAENPEGPDTGTGRVSRGGAWSYASALRAADRDVFSPSTRPYFLGFRCRRSP
ncbi:MAG: hypothetical protein D6795_18690 [Deltaproteobacteria bacterium]|nr:MAG: hypothetical protein D6795_18690 [Deltaproteobacteria bacterium]